MKRSLCRHVLGCRRLTNNHVQRGKSSIRSISLSLNVTDPEIIDILSKFESEEDRDRFAYEALRVGTIALSRPAAVESELNRTMRRYFDTENGELSRWIGNHRNSELSRTMNTNLDSFEDTVRDALREERERLLEQFSLDHKNSSLSRLRRDLEESISKENKVNRELQIEMNATLRALDARKSEEKRSTRHGLEFEDRLMSLVAQISSTRGDIFEHVGNITGRLKNCKIGDGVVEIGGESNTGEEGRIVLEAKRQKRYSVKQALEEIRTARTNRDAQIGLFVWDKHFAPEEMETISRYGDDIIVLWDCEDSNTDIFLKVGLSVARALCYREYHVRNGQDDEVKRVETHLRIAIPEIQRHIQRLDDVETWAKTILNNSEKILKRLSTTKKKLDGELGKLEVLC